MRKVDLGWVRVFVEVGRLGSLTEAAVVLNITQPAVSYQIRRAEAEFGCALVKRRSRGVELTVQGQELHQALARAVSHVDVLAERFRREGPRTGIRLFTDYAFSGLWLMPRLHRYHAVFPDHDLQIIASQSTDLSQIEASDLAVVFRNRADLPDDAVLLMPERVLPVCAPALVEGLPPGQIPDARLIHLDSAHKAAWLDWASYLDRAGLARDLRSQKGNLRFNTYSLVIDAALAGQGVALGWRGLVDPHLRRGELVQAGPEMTPAHSGYFLVQRPERLAGVDALKLWLISESVRAP